MTWELIESGTFKPFAIRVDLCDNTLHVQILERTTDHNGPHLSIRLRGVIKWDGCSSWTPIGDLHFSSLDQVRRYSRAMHAAYIEAREAIEGYEGR